MDQQTVNNQTQSKLEQSCTLLGPSESNGRDKHMTSNMMTTTNSPPKTTTTTVSEIESVFQDSCYNRNSTLVAKYVHRILEKFPTPSERYYDIRLVSGANRKSYFGETGDQCIMFHSNRVCLITLAPTHPVIVENKEIVKIEHTFEGFEKIDRLSSQPQGKSKKGSQKLQKNSPICAIICSDSTKYVITACLGSKLIEINQLVCARPNLVKERPLSLGFIAIIQPNDWKRMAEIRDSLPKLGQDISINACEEDGDQEPK